jgi:predicted site-specific integrase-resolvase
MKIETAPPAGDDVLLTSREAADMLGLKESTLAQYRHAGNHPLKFVRLNHQVVRYRFSDIRRYLREHTVRPVSLNGGQK